MNAKFHPKFQLNAVLCLIFAALLFSTYLGCHTRKINSKNQVSEEKIVAIDTLGSVIAKPVFEREKTADEALGYAVNFLSKSKWEFDFVYLYSYLQSKWHWRKIPAQDETQHVKDSLALVPNNSQFQEMRLFHRLLEPDFVLSANEFSQARELDGLTVPALYCDHFPVDTLSYFPILRASAEKGNYEASHALLAFIWAVEKGCIPLDEKKNSLKEVFDANYEILGDRPIWTDLQLEAAALLTAAGERLNPAWVMEVISAQNEDGGWPDYMKGNQSDTHATILAMWFLAGSNSQK